jgi:hypothetical protein
MSDAAPGWAVAMEARLAERLDGLTAYVDKLPTRAEFDKLPTRAEFDKLPTRAEFERLRADLDRARSDIMARIDRLQDELTRQGEEGVVNYNLSASTTGRLVALEDTVITLTRMLKRVQSRLDDLEGKQQGH